MTFNSDQLAFYVVQFLESPYEGIDDYVCVPHTWIIIRGQDGPSAVAYPNDEDPSFTRERVKRKEKCNVEWKYYLASVKYQSNSYQNAECWIASRNDHRPLVERIADNLGERETRSLRTRNSRSSTQGHSSKLNDNPRKPLLRIFIKRPALPEPYKQLDGKRLKLNKTAKSASASVTDANTGSKKEQPTSIQDNQSTKLAQTQETTAAASNINSRTEQRTQSQHTDQNKEALSFPVKDVCGPPEVMKIDVRHYSPDIKTSNENNSTSHSHLSDTAAVPMSAAKPSTSTEQNTQPYQYNNQEHLLDNRNSLSISDSQLEHIRYLVNADNDNEPRIHEVSSNTPTTSHKVMNSFKIFPQPRRNVNRSKELVQARKELKKIIRLSKMKCDLEMAAQNSSNLMDQPETSSTRSVEELLSVVFQTRSQDGSQVRDIHTENGTVQTDPLWKITNTSPEIQQTPKKNAETANTTPLASQNFPSSSYIPSTGRILTKLFNQLYQTSKFPQQKPSQSNQQDSLPTLQEVRKKMQSSIQTNLLKSMRSTLSASHNEYLRTEKQARLSQQSTENNDRDLTSSPKNVIVSTNRDKHQHVIDNAHQTGECVVKSLSPYNAVTSDSDTVTDEGISDSELSTNRAPVGIINDSTSTEITSASSSADRPSATQNSTLTSSSTDVRLTLEQEMLDNFAILFTQMGSTLRYTTDMYNNTLRNTILDTATTYRKLQSAIEQINSTQNSASNESFSINLNPEVRKSPEERHTKETASTSSSTQDQRSNDDANKPPKKKHNSWRFVLPPKYDPHDTKWTLKYRTNLPGLVELIPQSGVYVSYGDLKYCQHVSKDCKSLARRLLSAVFNRKALSVCLSIAERAQGSDNVGSNGRPELDDHAATVLLNFVLQHGLQRGWNTDLQPILNTLHSKIQEIRFKYGVVVKC